MSQFGGAARRVCAETKEEEPVWLCSRRAAALRHVAIAAPATLASTTAPQTKYGEERSAASSVRVSTQTVQRGAIPAPTGNVGPCYQNGGSYFDASQTHPAFGERPPMSAARGGII